VEEVLSHLFLKDHELASKFRRRDAAGRGESLPAGAREDKILKK
jgi:hypothetical protein